MGETAKDKKDGKDGKTEPDVEGWHREELAEDADDRNKIIGTDVRGRNREIRRTGGFAEEKDTGRSGGTGAVGRGFVRGFFLKFTKT